MNIFVNLVILVVILSVSFARRHGYKKSSKKIIPKVYSPQPHTYIKESDLPKAWDWRNINGTNYGTRAMTQQSPAVCGSCWAEAVTGALSDRFAIATGNKLRVQLSPQQLINFNEETSGGSCNGGDHLAAYEFIHKYGISDDTCQPFLGLNWAHGFDVAEMTEVKDVQGHQCHQCDWNGNCFFLPRKEYNLYGADEFGEVLGVHQMKAEIFQRGPIACLVNSDPEPFDIYKGGIITCEGSKSPACAWGDNYVDHVIVIAGWGYEEATKTPYWIGRNSYGSRWGEGAGGGWFRLKLGTNELHLESNTCTWATPAKVDVNRAVQQYTSSL